MSLYFKIKNKHHPNGQHQYTPQFRVETSAKDENNSDALAMRIADPLWMLGRQWQMGEFLGEDNGSPIQVEIKARKEHLNQYAFPKVIRDDKHVDITRFHEFEKEADKWESIHVLSEEELEEESEEESPTQLPPEVVVERMDIPIHTLRDKVRIGQMLEQLIIDNGKDNLDLRMEDTWESSLKTIPALRKAYELNDTRWHGQELPNSIDKKSNRFLKLMQGKVIDGGKIMETLAALKLAITDLEGVLDKLEAWYKKLFSQPEPIKEEEGQKENSSWCAHELAYKFKLSSKDEKQKIYAPDYQSGHLDWYSFDKSEIDSLPSNEPSNEEKEDYFFPTNVSFIGMPDKRLFSFEEGKIDLSKMNLDTPDLLQLMLLDFSMVSGSDWFTVPLKMELGQACWVESIEVVDVFGVTTTIKNGLEYDNEGKPKKDENGDIISKGAIVNENPLKVWDVFKIRDASSEGTKGIYEEKEHFLYLTPAATMRQESAPVEELLFMRDEYANLVWAVENKIPNAIGQAVNGYDLHLELYKTFDDLESTSDSELPQYKLASTVPTNWIPYLPQRMQDHQIELHQAVMVSNQEHQAGKDLHPLTHLAGADIDVVREEAIPRAGVRVQLTKQRIRWTDGRTYVWLGRKVLAGRGEGNSGLRFDYLK